MEIQKKRLEEIQKVLVRTFFMNLVACLIKIVLGFYTGILAIAADGFHSLGDSLSNIIGFLGIRLAKKKPDDKYAYGYDKFESFVTLLIVSIISVTCYKIFEGGIHRLMHPQEIQVNPFMMIIVVASIGINIITIWYEGGAGRSLKSEFLIADSNETKSDLWVSSLVVAGVLIISRIGWNWLDGALSLLVGLFVLRVIWEIIVSTAKTLADGQVVSPSAVTKIVLAVPGVEFCHAVRSRGREEAFYLDLHLGTNKDLTIEEAHDDICHQAKIALHKAFPGLKSANIHIEPDNEDGRGRANSVFRKRDSYNHGKELLA